MNISWYIQSISFLNGKSIYFQSFDTKAHLQYTFFWLFLMACYWTLWTEEFKVERHKDFVRLDTSSDAPVSTIRCKGLPCGIVIWRHRWLSVQGPVCQAECILAHLPAAEGGHEHKQGTSVGSLKSLRDSVPKIWVSTVIPWLFVPSAWAPLGWSGKGSHIPFQGKDDAHLCSEKFQRWQTLEIIMGTLLFAEQARELHKQLYFSSTVK